MNNKAHDIGTGRLVVSLPYGRKRIFENVLVDSIEFYKGILIWEYAHNDRIENFIGATPYTFQFEYDF